MNIVRSRAGIVLWVGGQGGVPKYIFCPGPPSPPPLSPPRLSHHLCREVSRFFKCSFWLLPSDWHRKNLHTVPYCLDYRLQRVWPFLRKTKHPNSILRHNYQRFFSYIVPLWVLFGLKVCKKYWFFTMLLKQWYPSPQSSLHSLIKRSDSINSKCCFLWFQFQR